jgi:hypothetical protein
MAKALESLQKGYDADAATAKARAKELQDALAAAQDTVKNTSEENAKLSQENA